MDEKNVVPKNLAVQQKTFVKEHKFSVVKEQCYPKMSSLKINSCEEITHDSSENDEKERFIRNIKKNLAKEYKNNR